MTMHYIINSDGIPVKEGNILRWEKWFEENHLKNTKQTDLPDGVMVSTVFLGIDHNFLGDGPPVLWETMVFGGKYDGSQRRYTIKEEAERDHDLVVARLRENALEYNNKPQD